MAFQKGISGNPHGRPKLSKEAQELLNAEADKSFEVIVRLRDTSNNDKIKLEAAQYLIERQYGKVVQPIGNENPETPFLVKTLK